MYLDGLSGMFTRFRIGNAVGKTKIKGASRNTFCMKFSLLEQLKTSGACITILTQLVNYFQIQTI